MPHSEQNPATVLVVEDEVLTQQMAVHSVEHAGFMALAVESAEDAIRLLRENDRIIALFTDIWMPGPMDGLALAREAVLLRPEVKIVITSGLTRPPDSDMPDQGRFLAKPYTTSQVANVLRTLID
jgi:two-component system, response regulator PdtaR